MKSNLSKWLITGTSFVMGYFIAQSILRSARKMNVKGKVVLISGGSRGLGYKLAQQLADKGARIAICARNEDGLKKAADDLSFRTPYLLSVPCDITNKEQVKSMVSQVKEKFGSIDVLINNAGTVKIGPMEKMTEEDYKEAMNVYFWGPFHIVNEVYPLMKTRKSGRIVNIVSIGGKLSFPHLLPYTTSKFALSGFSEGITSELSKDNIHVTTVYPGLMRTGSPRHAKVKGQYEKEYTWFKHSDSFPILTISADKAAKKIIKAFRKGKKTLTLTVPAKVGKVVHEIAPDLTISYFDLINSLLPDVEEGGEEPKKGEESESNLSSTFATKTTETAAERNNEKL